MPFDTNYENMNYVCVNITVSNWLFIEMVLNHTVLMKTIENTSMRESNIILINNGIINKVFVILFLHYVT